MLGRGIALRFGCKLRLLETYVGGHVLARVTARQLAHAVVERVEPGQGDELKLVAHGSQFALEVCDGAVVEVLLPVERRRAVVRQQLVREYGTNCLGELTCKV